MNDETPPDERDLTLQWASLVFNPAWQVTIEAEAAQQFQQAVQDALDITKPLEQRNAASGRAQAWNVVLAWGRQWKDAHTAMVAEQQAEKEETPDVGAKVEDQWYEQQPG